MAIRPADHGIVASASGGAEGMEFIAKVGPMNGTTTLVSFTSIPQTYRHLRIVMANGRRDSTDTAIYLSLNNNTTAADYGGYLSMTTGPSIDADFGDMRTDSDNPDTTNSSAAVWDIADYANASVWHSIQWQYAADQFNSGDRSIGTVNWHPSSLAAVTEIYVLSKYTSSAYYLEAPTTFTLFGIGTAA